jgi:hypothetical protein
MERNQVLKQYEIGFFSGPVTLVAGTEAATIDDNLFCPIAYGPYEGEDCRDVLQEAITWWKAQLSSIQAAVAQSRTR